MFHQFHRLLKSKFYSKCKSVIKAAKIRVDAIQRRRNAMHKFLRSDIALLLKNGSLDYDAYGRAEGLLIEINLSFCYDYLKQSFDCISTHLSAMNLQKECPEECREAVASVIFAAARFADLPELRELRGIFTKRYGYSLESYVNKEFVEKLNIRHPTKDMKLQLMQEIAEENGIEWDSKALEQKLFKPPPSEQDMFNDDDSNYQVSIKDNENKPKDTLVETYHVNPKVSTDETTTSSESSMTSPKSKSVRRGHHQSVFNDLIGTKEKKDPSEENQVEKLSLKILLSGKKSNKEDMEMDNLLEYYSKKKSLFVGKNKDDFIGPTDTRGRQKSSSYVHPNLPDYDDVVARFAALKEK